MIIYLLTYVFSVDGQSQMAVLLISLSCCLGDVSQATGDATGEYKVIYKRVWSLKVSPVSTACLIAGKPRYFESGLARRQRVALSRQSTDGLGSSRMF